MKAAYSFDDLDDSVVSILRDFPSVCNNQKVVLNIIDGLGAIAVSNNVHIVDVVAHEIYVMLDEEKAGRLVNVPGFFSDFSNVLEIKAMIMEIMDTDGFRRMRDSLCRCAKGSTIYSITAESVSIRGRYAIFELSLI